MHPTSTSISSLCHFSLVFIKNKIFFKERYVLIVLIRCKTKDNFLFFFYSRQLHIQIHYVLPVVLWGMIHEMLMSYIEMNIWVKVKMRQSGNYNRGSYNSIYDIIA